VIFKSQHFNELGFEPPPWPLDRIDATDKVQSCHHRPGDETRDFRYFHWKVMAGVAGGIWIEMPDTPRLFQLQGQFSRTEPNYVRKLKFDMFLCHSLSP
jgi:hypothetical protein